MRILFLSDIHGVPSALATALSAADSLGFDRLVLLGDLLYHGPRNDLPEGYDPKAVIAMLSQYADKLFCVRGNCDTEVDQMVLPFPIMAETALLFVDGKTWFACHGHRSGANPTANDLPKLPAGSVVLSGHTHIPVLETNQDGITLFNPGSTSIPKGGFPASYGVYEDGHFAVIGFEGERIFEYGEA